MLRIPGICVQLEAATSCYIRHRQSHGVGRGREPKVAVFEAAGPEAGGREAWIDRVRHVAGPGAGHEYTEMQVVLPNHGGDDWHVRGRDPGAADVPGAPLSHERARNRSTKESISCIRAQAYPRSKRAGCHHASLRCFIKPQLTASSHVRHRQSPFHAAAVRNPRHTSAQANQTTPT